MIKNTSQTGFTLVETLVATMILLIALVAPLTIVTKTSQGNSLANDRVVAFFLAQEGVELAQQLRDQSAINFVDIINQDPNDPILALSNSSLTWYPVINGVDYSVCITGCGLSRFAGMPNPSEQALLPKDCVSNMADCMLYFHTSHFNEYSHEASGGTPSKFTRVITINDVVANEEAQIVSTVTWRSGLFFQEQQVQVTTSVFNVYYES